MSDDSNNSFFERLVKSLYYTFLIHWSLGLIGRLLRFLFKPIPFSKIKYSKQLFIITCIAGTVIYYTYGKISLSTWMLISGIPFFILLILNKFFFKSSSPSDEDPPADES